MRKKIETDLGNGKKLVACVAPNDYGLIEIWIDVIHRNGYAQAIAAVGTGPSGGFYLSAWDDPNSEDPGTCIPIEIRSRFVKGARKRK